MPDITPGPKPPADDGSETQPTDRKKVLKHVWGPADNEQDRLVGVIGVSLLILLVIAVIVRVAWTFLD